MYRILSTKHLTALLALVLALTLVGPVAAQPTTAPAGDTAAQVEGQTIRIGTNAEYPPFEEINEDGEFVGFDIDLMEALAADAGFEIEWVNTRWDGIFFALAEGEFDAVISAATITAQRERIVDFSDPYFVASQSISVRSEMAEDVATPDDLAGLRVGVQTGTTGDEYASNLDGVEVVRFDETTLAFQALGQGDIDAVIADTPASAAIIANNPELEATIVGDPLTAEFYGIAVRPGFPELLEAFNISLANLFDDGTYAEIHEEHFDAPPPDFLLEGDFELGVFAVDETDPASVAYYGLYTVLVLNDSEEHAVVSCEAYIESDAFPTEEDMEEIATISFDLSGVEVETTEAEDGAITASYSGMLVLDDGTQEVEVEVNEIVGGLGEVTLVETEDGLWQFCPAGE